jgi:hypothetical protein
MTRISQSKLEFIVSVKKREKKTTLLARKICWRENNTEEKKETYHSLPLTVTE